MEVSDSSSFKVQGWGLNSFLMWEYLLRCVGGHCKQEHSGENTQGGAGATVLLCEQQTTNSQVLHYSRDIYDQFFFSFSSLPHAQCPEENLSLWSHFPWWFSLQSICWRSLETPSLPKGNIRMKTKPWQGEFGLVSWMVIEVFGKPCLESQFSILEMGNYLFLYFFWTPCLLKLLEDGLWWSTMGPWSWQSSSILQ